MKKMGKAALVATSAMLLLAGCSSGGGKKNSGEQKTDGDGTKVFSAFFAVPGKEVPGDSRLNQAMAKLIKAKADITWLTGQTAKERIGVMISGGNYPDLVDASEGRPAMIDAGAYVPLEDKLDKYPNLKGLYTDIEWEKIKASNGGHIWTIPQFSATKGEDMATSYGQEAFWLQKRVVKWANYPKIKTVDEYFKLINDYLAANPETDGQPTIGFEILSDDWRYFCLENPPMFLAGYPNDGAAIVDNTTFEAKVYDKIPEAKAYYKILGEQYAKGTIDPETFTAKYDQYIAKLSSGRVLGMIDQGWNIQTAIDSLRSQGSDELTYVPFGLTLDPSVKPQYREKRSLNIDGGIGITVNCKDVDGALQFLNDLLSEEATILRSWGEKETDYKIDDKGKFYRTKEQRDNWKNQDYALKTGLAYGYLPAYTGMLPDGINTVNPGEQPDEFRETLVDIDKEILDGYSYKKWTDFMEIQDPVTPWFPIYTARGSWTSKDPAGIASQNMQDIKMEWLPKVIMGNPTDFDKNWESYMSAYDAKVDVASYEGALTKEVKRRIEIDKELQAKAADGDKAETTTSSSK